MDLSEWMIHDNRLTTENTFLIPYSMMKVSNFVITKIASSTKLCTYIYETMYLKLRNCLPKTTKLCTYIYENMYKERANYLITKPLECP